MVMEQALPRNTSLMETLWNILLVIVHIVEVYVEAIYRFLVPPPMRSLTGEIILVTGSAHGLGRAICTNLAQYRVTLVLWDCDDVANRNTVRELQLLKTTKARLLPYQVDLSQRTCVEVTAEKVKNDVGDVTVVINNAGIAPIAPLLQTDSDLVEKTFQINVLSHFWILKEFLPRMIENHHGHIVSVCSVGAMRQCGASVPYFGSKAAVHGVCESLKLQMNLINAHGIKFTTIYPYFMETRMMKDVTKKRQKLGPVALLQKLLPFLKPEDVAERLVTGMRRNYEYIYVPSFLPYVIHLENLLPLRLRREFQLQFDLQFEHPNFPSSLLHQQPPLLLSQSTGTDLTLGHRHTHSHSHSVSTTKP